MNAIDDDLLASPEEVEQDMEDLKPKTADEILEGLRELATPDYDATVDVPEGYPLK